MTYLPKKQRGRKPGTPLSKAELRQRRNAAKMSTGPKTEKGKATSSLNAYQTGLFSKKIKATIRGKPCFSTCEKFSTCIFVLHEKTRPGGKCLDVADWEIVEEATIAIITAMDCGDTSKLNAIAAANMGMLIGVAQQTFMDIQQRGVNVDQLLTNKNGDIIGSQTMGNPHINNLIKILDKVGINLTDFIATPMAKQKMAVETEEAETAAAITRRIMDRFGPLPGNTGQPIEAEVVK